MLFDTIYLLSMLDPEILIWGVKLHIDIGI